MLRCWFPETFSHVFIIICCELDVNDFNIHLVWRATHAYAYNGMRVCLLWQSSPHVVCKLSTTPTHHALQLFFFVCPCVLCIAGILWRISSRGQSAKALKRLFFFFFSFPPTCVEVKPAVSVPYESLPMCFSL